MRERRHVIAETLRGLIDFEDFSDKPEMYADAIIADLAAEGRTVDMAYDKDDLAKAFAWVEHLAFLRSQNLERCRWKKKPTDKQLTREYTAFRRRFLDMLGIDGIGDGTFDDLNADTADREIDRLAKASWEAADGHISGVPWDAVKGTLRGEKERRRVRAIATATTLLNSIKEETR